MSVDNPLWGAPRIHGELLKLGFEVAQSSVANRSKPMVGAMNRSMAAMSGAWLRRKVRHPGEGGPHRLTMYFATLD